MLPTSHYRVCWYRSLSQFNKYIYRLKSSRLRDTVLVALLSAVIGYILHPVVNTFAVDPAVLPNYPVPQSTWSVDSESVVGRHYVQLRDATPLHTDWGHDYDPVDVVGYNYTFSSRQTYNLVEHASHRHIDWPAWLTNGDCDRGEWVDRDNSSHYIHHRVDGETQIHAMHKYEYRPLSSACQLPRFDGHHMLKMLSGRTLAIMGDSLMATEYGWLSSLLPLLQPYLIRSILIRHPHTPKPDHTDRYGIQVYHYQYNVTIKFQVLGSTTLDGNNAEVPMAKLVYPTMWRSDIILFNAGAWFSPNEEHLRLLSVMRDFLDFAHQHYAGQMIYREYLPSFFVRRNETVNDTWMGEYLKYRGESPPAVVDLRCATVQEISQLDVDKWMQRDARVNAMNAMMAEYNIPVLPVFRPSALRSDLVRNYAHQYDEDGPHCDCRHYISDTAVQQVWFQLFSKLLVDAML